MARHHSLPHRLVAGVMAKVSKFEQSELWLSQHQSEMLMN